MATTLVSSTNIPCLYLTKLTTGVPKINKRQAQGKSTTAGSEEDGRNVASYVEQVK